MTNTENRQNQIIFQEGKEKALKEIFTGSGEKTPIFGYLAIGYDEDKRGFINPTQEGDENGFKEINDDQTYARTPLSLFDVERDQDTGKVLCKFTADLDIDNIIKEQPINQFAIVDQSGRSEDTPTTTFYAASMFEDIIKNDKLAITFVIGFRF